MRCSFLSLLARGGKTIVTQQRKKYNKIRDLYELLVLGVVIALRALLSLLIHFEMKHGHHEGEDNRGEK